MKTATRSFQLAALAGAVILGATAAQAVDFHVGTAQDLQSALTLAAGNGANNNIWLGNATNAGYYAGSFSYNSSSGMSLVIQPEAGLTNTQITIDPGGGGRGLSLTTSNALTGGSVSVSGITFLRNTGSSTAGALRIAATSSGAILVDGCRFLSPTNNTQGMGLEVVAGLATTIRNCLVIGKTNGSVNDGDGIYIAAVNGATLLANNVVVGNYGGYGADILASSVLTVTNNIFQTNSAGLYFNPASGNKTAGVVVSNNVFGSCSGFYSFGASIQNFGMLNMGANNFNGNKGGGAYIYSGMAANLTANTFYGNGYGGGWGGAYLGLLNVATVTGNTFSGNMSPNAAGGIYLNNATNLLSGNTFSGNVANGVGGAVKIESSGVLNLVSNNTFSANTANNNPGGGVYSAANGLVTITGNSFTGNSCNGNSQGGAVYLSSSGTNFVTANLFQQNASPDGAGAIYAASPAITISGNLVLNNTQTGAGATGGGMGVNPGNVLYLINNTIFGNSSAGGGGGAAFQISGTQSLYVFNNIIWGNSATGSGADVYLAGGGQQTALQYNDINGIYGVWNLAAPMWNVDPKFGNTIGGDFHLQTNSTLLNAGTNGAAFLPLTDFDGNARTNAAGQVDLGCYEFNNTATHPADTDSNLVITAAEYSAYAAAWKAGQAWASGPNPISANYVTRAGYLMTNGGAYYNNGSARPTNWKPQGQ